MNISAWHWIVARLVHAMQDTKASTSVDDSSNGAASSGMHAIVAAAQQSADSSAAAADPRQVLHLSRFNSTPSCQLPPLGNYS